MFWHRKRNRESTVSSAAIDPARMEEPLACMLTDMGLRRELNEDSVCIVRAGAARRADRGFLAVVADGMGGHQAGEVASRTAVETIEREYLKLPGTPGEALEKAFRSAHQSILRLAQDNAQMAGMGTTCTAIAIVGWQAWAVHVGDSRLYLVREREIYQLSEDHTQCMEMVRKGIMTLAEARQHADRSVLTHAMGTRPELVLMKWPEPMAVKPRDVFVLCSDGLHDLVADREIGEMVWDSDPYSACNNLVSSACARGGYDNISLVVVAVPPISDCISSLKETGQYGVSG
ncbi:MAG: serine/threonine-protein phosphatase [Acidobacteria bacterium]|nr:serine/threonine-protein phosphatase [Acidobacteriota bacterium]